MPLEIRQSAAAREDLIEIWLYIDTYNTMAANRILDRIEQLAIRLAEQPEMGRLALDSDRRLRVFPIEGYSVFYRASDTELTIVRVLSHYRDATAQSFPET